MLQKLPTYKSLIKLLFLSCTIGLFAFQSPKSKYPYSPRNLHSLTKRIHKDLESLLKIKDDIDDKKCPEINSLDTIIKRKEMLFKKVSYFEIDSVVQKITQDTSKNMNLPCNKILTIGKNGIVNKRKITFERESCLNFVQENLGIIEDELSFFKGFLSNYKKTIQNCEFTKCAGIEKQGSTHPQIKIIEHGLRYYVVSDADFENNKGDIEGYVKRYANRTNESSREKKDPTYMKFRKAIVEYLKYRLGKVNKCNNSHQNFSYLVEKPLKGNCQLKNLEKVSKSWKTGTINSDWIAQEFERTKECATNQRGCPYECAENYGGENIKINDGSCKGCMDKKAERNYCEGAKKPGMCIYTVCQNWTNQDIKKEYPRYNAQIDSLAFDNKYCDAITEVMKPKEVNCGCLDTSAVNYVLRPEFPKYYKPNIKISCPDSCHWRGCMDTCAINFNPRARVADGSCVCEEIDEDELEQKLNWLTMNANTKLNDAKQLYKEFVDQLPRKLRKLSEGTEFLLGANNSLIVKADLETKIKSSADGYGLGVYEHELFRQYTDELTLFVEKKMGGGFGKNKVSGKIIGEADNAGIGSNGITFKEGTIKNEPFKALNPHTEIEIEQVDLTPDTLCNILDGKIKSNLYLAFVRAYMIKKRIIRLIEETTGTNKILIGAKANVQGNKEGSFRRISMIFIIEEFFTSNEESQEKEATKEKILELRKIKEWLRINKTNTLKKCLCMPDYWKDKIAKK